MVQILWSISKNMIEGCIRSSSQTRFQKLIFWIFFNKQRMCVYCGTLIDTPVTRQRVFDFVWEIVSWYPLITMPYTINCQKIFNKSWWHNTIYKINLKSLKNTLKLQRYRSVKLVLATPTSSSTWKLQEIIELSWCY